MTEEQAAIEVQGLLHAAGFRGKLIPGQPDTVESAASGLEFYVITYNFSVQFRAGVKVSQHVISDFRRINEFNRQYRFSKVYVSEEAIFLESDALINFDDDHSNLAFQNAIQMWEVSLSTFRDWLREEPGGVGEASDGVA